MNGQGRLQVASGNPPEGYFDTRYAVLREPLAMPRGSECLGDDSNAEHAWVEVEGRVVAVGRAHMIPHGSNGSGSDHEGPDAVRIPPFGPLEDGTVSRPAFQIRQMGTLPSHRRCGHAAAVLSALEQRMVVLHGAKTGLLQAREVALEFYRAQGWTVVDEPYDIPGIGPHRSMIKTF